MSSMIPTHSGPGWGRGISGESTGSVLGKKTCPPTQKNWLIFSGGFQIEGEHRGRGLRGGEGRLLAGFPAWRLILRLSPLVGVDNFHEAKYCPLHCPPPPSGLFSFLSILTELAAVDAPDVGPHPYCGVVRVPASRDAPRAGGWGLGGGEVCEWEGEGCRRGGGGTRTTGTDQASSLCAAGRGATA